LNMGRFGHGEFWMGSFGWGVLNMQVILPG
jgi:hypothetical protein